MNLPNNLDKKEPSFKPLKATSLDKKVAKVCPFCGSVPVRIEHLMGNTTVLISVDCFNPSCEIKPNTQRFNSLKEALTSWNKRN